MTAAPSSPGRASSSPCLLSPAELAAARRNTLNAHYTDAALVQAMWAAVRALGFERRPGAGTGLRQRELHRVRPRRRPGDRDRAGPGDRGHRGPAVPGCRRSAPSRSPTAATPTAATTWRSGTCRSGTWCCTTAATTRPGTASTTTSSSSRCTWSGPAAWSRCSPPGTRWTPATRPRAARSPRWPTWSARSGCPAAPTSGPPAPAWSPTCWSCAAANQAASPTRPPGSRPGSPSWTAPRCRSTSTSSTTRRRCSAGWEPCTAPTGPTTWWSAPSGDTIAATVRRAHGR